MSESPELLVRKSDGEIVSDGRKTPRAPNLKHLRYSKRLPPECNRCPYRPKEEGGTIGGCSVYKADHLCSIRADIRKEIEKYSVDTPSAILPLLEEEFEATYEFLKFFHTMENMAGIVNAEVSKRMNALTNLGKLIAELKKEKITMEATQTNTLTDDSKEEIAKTLRFIIEKPSDG